MSKYIFFVFLFNICMYQLSCYNVPFKGRCKQMTNNLILLTKSHLFKGQDQCLKILFFFFFLMTIMLKANSWDSC